MPNLFQRSTGLCRSPILVFAFTRQTLNLWTSSQKDLDRLINWGDEDLDDYRTNKTQWRNSLPQRFETLSEILHLNDRLSDLFQNFPTYQKLILIPHCFLHLFPIHALPVVREQGTGNGEQEVGVDCIRSIPEGASVAPLQEIFPKGVSYAPNCQLLQQTQNRPPRHEI